MGMVRYLTVFDGIFPRQIYLYVRQYGIFDGILTVCRVIRKAAEGKLFY